MVGNVVGDPRDTLWKRRYEKRKARMLADTSICIENRRLFAEFFAWEEHKLKRLNGLRELDEACYKTLYGYTSKLPNVNRWFGNKPWTAITREDIRQVYEALEDGRIRNQHGKPYEDLSGYYNKIMKYKPFRLAGKDSLTRDVIEYTRRDRKDVRFVTEETFRSIVNMVRRPDYQLLLWLAWDIGENVGTLLLLSPEDFMPQYDSRTGQREYIVHLRQEKLKRARTSRGELTLYPETAQLLDEVLSYTKPGERLFELGYASAAKMFRIAVGRARATTLPNGQPARLKDLRSGMACHLLRMGWTTDEVNARLGHTPQSHALNAYINFLAIPRAQPKHRLQHCIRSAKRHAGQPFGHGSFGVCRQARVRARRPKRKLSDYVPSFWPITVVASNNAAVWQSS